MHERRSRAARRARLATWIVSLALALGACATAHEATMPDDDAPSPESGGTSAAAGASTMTGSGAIGVAGANSAAATNAGAPSDASGAAGATSTGGHSGGTTGGASNHAGGAAGSGAGASSVNGGNAGTSSGAVLFSDDFENGTASGWTTSAGTWAITSDGSNVYAQTATGTGSSVLSSTPKSESASWTDEIVGARIKINAFGGSSTSYFAAIYGRYDGSNYYCLALRSDGKLAIRKNTTTLGSAVAVGIATGTWYTVRLEIVGATLKAYVNGALADTETDSTLSAGGVALATVNTTAEFDDVRVSRP